MNNSVHNKREVKAVILDSGFDFGRCPLASHLPAALWPICGKPAVKLLIERLCEYGISEAVICSNSDNAKVRQELQDGQWQIKLSYSEFKLPTGTAGSFRDAARGDRDSLWLIVPASMTNIPDFADIIQSHYGGKSEMTVVLNPPEVRNGMHSQATGIYVCEPVVLDSIPAVGYYDIKESLVPELLRSGKNIHVVRLPRHAGNFRNHAEYLSAISGILGQKHEVLCTIPLYRKDGAQTIWKAADVTIPDSARIYGPVVLMEGSRISEGSVVFGPTVVGRYAYIGPNSLVANSVLWDYSKVESNCTVQRCIAGTQAVVAGERIVHEAVFLPGTNEVSKPHEDSHPMETCPSSSQQFLGNISCQPIGKNVFLMFNAAVLLGVFIWSNWFGLKDLWEIWQRSDEYSSGLLVPFLAAYILWLRRERFASCRIHPSLWGLILFVAAQGLKFAGLFFMYSSLERFSIVVSVAGLLLFLLGWDYFKKAFTILLFLCLMLPLPASIHSSLLLPLQSWATASAVFCLEVIGYDVIRTGNIIDINGTTVAVIEACNGLRMIMAFFVIGGFIVLLSKKAKWEKLLVFLSSIPIALVCNTIRLTLTSIAFTYVKGEYWEKIFHDFGGYAMMPLAIGIIIFEFWLLEKIVTIGTVNQPASEASAGV